MEYPIVLLSDARDAITEASTLLPDSVELKKCERTIYEAQGARPTWTVMASGLLFITLTATSSFRSTVMSGPIASSALCLIVLGGPHIPGVMPLIRKACRANPRERSEAASKRSGIRTIGRDVALRYSKVKGPLFARYQTSSQHQNTKDTEQHGPYYSKLASATRDQTRDEGRKESRGLLQRTVGTRGRGVAG
jgi:hypothetical protein